MLAKICSEQRKPNNHFLLKADTQKILAFVHDLNIRKIPGKHNFVALLLLLN